MKKILLFALLLIAPHLRAQTCTAASTSSAAVQAALTSCIAGGTVVIPSGSSTWSTTVSIAPTGPLTIVGANICTGGCASGAGGTSLAFTNNTNITLANATAGFQIGPCSATVFCDVSLIHFLPTVADSNGAVQIQGTHGQVGFRIHHLQVDCSLGTGVDLFLYDGYGLVDHYLANDTSSAGTECTPINMGGDLPTAGAQNWTDTTNIGTNQSIILEDSNFASTNGGSTEGVFDSYYGCKVTLRHNIFTGFELGGWHGTDSGGFRSCVLGEIYNNSITNSSGISMQLMNTRGGTLLLSNNTVGGSTAWTPIDLQYFRVLGQNHSAQWGTGAPGLNWVPISATPTNALSDVVTLNAPDWQATHTYTCSSGSPCLIGPLLHNTGTGVSGAAGYNYESNANCISSVTEPNPWNQTFPAGTQSDGTCTWTNVGGGTTAGPGGSGFLSTNPDTPCSSGGSCTRFLDASGGYPYRDQPGRVHNQVLAPNYAWSNTLPGSLSASTLMGTDSATASIIQSGTDYVNNTAMPGYTPYTYPDPLQNQTWYVRADGGTRFSTNVTSGQCDGLADVSYASTGGTGTNQHCAYNDFRYMWDDDSGSVGAGAWVIAGGDTVVVRGCHALATQQNPANPTCRIGWDIDSGGGPTNLWCQGVGNITCYNPPIPAGTAGQHTKILGGCAFGTYTCAPANVYPYTANNLTQIFGGFSLFWTLNMTSTSYVDIEGIEITDHNGACSHVGTPSYPSACTVSSPFSDYARNGVLTNNTMSNITFQDVYIHGFDGTGLNGPIGGPIAMTRVIVGFNGQAGWLFDDGSSTPDGAGSTITASYVTMIGNGCHEQYPIVNTSFPAMACYDSSSGGFGDSWSGQSTNLDSFTCDHCVMMYNAKDGFIGPETQIAALSITNSVSMGNMGQQWKWGMQTSATLLFQNNLTVGDCFRMSEALPGAAQNFNVSTGLGGSYLSNYCRASGNMMDTLQQIGDVLHYNGNTFIMTDGGGVEFDCGPTGGGSTNCNTITNDWKDNNFLGYSSPNFSSVAPFMWFVVSGSNVVFTSEFNSEFGIRAGDTCGTNNIICGDPLMKSEPAQIWPGSYAALDVFNPFGGTTNSFYPSSSSPLIHAGTTVSGLTTDYYAVARPSPPSMGAVEPNSAVASPVKLTGKIVLSGKVTLQ